MTPRLQQEIRDLRARFWSERDPHGRGFVPLADALRRAGDLDEARSLLDEGIGRHPAFASAHLVSSWLHRDQGDVAAEEEALRQVLALDPENARALHGLGQLLARGGRLAAGRELVGRALELDPLLEWEEGGAPEEPLSAEPAVQEPAAQEPAAEPLPEAVAEAGVVDIRALAPQAPDGILGDPDGRGAVVEIGFLAPRPAAPARARFAATTGDEPRTGAMEDPWAPVMEDEVVDIGTLAPELPSGALPDDRPLVEIGALAPDPPAPPPARAEPPVEEADDDRVHYTRTMVELLARQGLYANALDVARHLLERTPGDEALRRRVAELEELEGTAPPPAPEPPSRRPPPPAEEEGADEGVADYLRDLLGWPDPDEGGTPP